ncbi:MAG TPA: glutamate-1-semialdehyde 2,1-aminomutase [Candidatus Eisenbacteria bacterium]|jgi:glutamate-1-semialdehyde 2,1-aminomutase|nr:glutamate-1-semialdehyde 2,1-aminomutase [Candidatus Eisenbacteria bacterium]
MTAKPKIFLRATRRIPGGVNSPVRAWKSVGGVPLFIARGRGSYVFDANGKRYLDFVGSWGPLILGHAHPKVVQVVQRQARQGVTFGAPTMLEVELAEAVAAAVPSIEKLRLVSSGTEATMSAIRLARAFTGRSKIIKFDGCYHGHSDGLLVKAGSGIATLSLPESAGVPRSFACETLIAKYNDSQSLQKIFARYKNKVAAVIVEPICGNMGVIKPEPDFLPGLRQITRENGALLIFDEVITGFRVAYGGAQSLYQVRPDLTCLGKILGGGLPLAGFGGRSEIMDLLAPVGPVYQAGTLSGNPLAVAAGLATIKLLSRPAIYEKLEAQGAYLEEGMREILAHSRLEATINRVGSMMTIFFGIQRVSHPDEARNCDRNKFVKFFHAMLDRRIYLPPAPFEAMFISLAHSKNDLVKFLKAFDHWTRRSNG